MPSRNNGLVVSYTREAKCANILVQWWTKCTMAHADARRRRVVLSETADRVNVVAVHAYCVRQRMMRVKADHA